MAEIKNRAARPEHIRMKDRIIANPPGNDRISIFVATKTSRVYRSGFPPFRMRVRLNRCFSAEGTPKCFLNLMVPSEYSHPISPFPILLNARTTLQKLPVPDHRHYQVIVPTEKSIFIHGRGRMGYLKIGISNRSIELNVIDVNGF